MVVPTWPSIARRSLKMKEDMVAANTRPAAVTTRAGTRHRADDAGVESGVKLLFESGDQQQVVVGPHRQQQDDRQWRRRSTDNWMPKMYCHTSTDNPNDAPSDSATVPTMTSAATRLRVMKTMISRMRLSAASAAIIRSYFAPS